MSKNVRFDGSSRSSRHDRDSGVGSLSSDQASTGGKPDRKFTAQDRESQRYNLVALQEALDAANVEVRSLKKKCVELDLELSGARKLSRDTEIAYRTICDENEALRLQVGELKKDVDDYRDENHDLHQQLLTYTQPVGAPMMTGGSGSVRRTASRRDSGERQKDRLRERINKSSPEAEGSSSSSSKGHRRSHSRRPSSSKKPYIEEPPSPTRSYSTHYVVTSAPTAPAVVTRIDPPNMSSIPRTSHGGISSGHRNSAYIEETGNYIAFPLPEEKPSKHRKQR